MGERLLIQPGGAVGVIGYSRTTGTWNAQQDLVSLFRSLSEQNPNTLGEFLVGARLFRLSDLVTVRNLMLLGDPALNIRTRAPAPADTFDVAVGTSDIRTAWGSYAHSAGTIEVTVHNAWKTDVYDLEVELWRGEPGSEGSSLFGTEVIDTLRAYGPDVVTFSVSGLEGNVRLYVVLDPDDLIAERAEDNNIAFRDFLALPYEGAYPTRLQFNGAERSVTIADLASAPGKEVLVSGFTSTDRVLQCYAVGDTQAVWTYGTGSV
ncbi:MAG: C25 family cysteine peptidase, partial [Candidatus Krumholzibacteria bacterium]|nr:C25 family cysteine peptidase [Candidatus Krumholzibacteria bacterium]